MKNVTWENLDFSVKTLTSLSLEKNEEYLELFDYILSSYVYYKISGEKISFSFLN